MLGLNANIVLFFSPRGFYKKKLKKKKKVVPDFNVYVVMLYNIRIAYDCIYIILCFFYFSFYLNKRIVK